MEIGYIRELATRLLESDVTAYRIKKETGVYETTTNKLRSDLNRLDNIPLGNAEKLAAYQLKLEKSEEN